jgi:hypothetical protein
MMTATLQGISPRADYQGKKLQSFMPPIHSQYMWKVLNILYAYRVCNNESV